MTMTGPIVAVVDYTSEILALRAAIAAGVTSASYDGKSVTYDDLAGMQRRLSLLEKWQLQALNPRYRAPQAGFATFSRGGSRTGW